MSNKDEDDVVRLARVYATDDPVAAAAGPERFADESIDNVVEKLRDMLSRCRSLLGIASMPTDSGITEDDKFSVIEEAELLLAETDPDPAPNCKGIRGRVTNEQNCCRYCDAGPEEACRIP